MHIGRAALSIAEVSENTDACAFRIKDTVDAFCKANKIRYKNIQSIIFTQTQDIHHFNPAQLLRKHQGFESLALFCSVEPEYPSILPQVIRMLIFFRVKRMFFSPTFIYKYGTELFRPDLLLKKREKKSKPG